MKTFKQFLLEDPQRGKTIVFYHRTGLGGQSGSHKHMKQENIEDHVDSFLTSGFHIGKGQLYGPGIYGFYTEDSTLGREGGGYGNIVLKTKVNTDKILITVPEVAKKVYGRDITLEEQFKILKLKYPSEQMIDWEKKYNRVDNVGLSIVGYYGQENMPKLIKGLVYRGGQDLEAMVVYDPKLLTIISYNTTINDSTKLDGTWINVLNKNKNQIKTALTQRLVSLSSPEKTLDEIEFLKNLRQHVSKNYDTMSEKQKRKLDLRIIDYVKKDGKMIKFIISAGIKPSEAVQVAAVEKHGVAIQDIMEAGIEPSEKVISAAIEGGWYSPPKEIYVKLTDGQKKKIEKNQIAAVKNDGLAILYIIKAGYTPSEAVQIAATKKDWRAIEFIIDAGIEPSEDIQVAAIDGGLYYPSKEFYDKSSKELKEKIEKNQLAAVKLYWRIILSIIKAGYEPPEAVQIAAVKQDWGAIQDIIRAGYEPPEAVQIAAVKQDWGAIRYIIKGGYELSERVQLAAVEEDWEAIKTIINAGYTPSEDVQIAAVGNNIRAITFIENVKDSVIKYMIDNYNKSRISNILSKNFESKETKQKLQAAFDKKYG